MEKCDLKPNVYFSNKGRSNQSILFQCLHCGLINQIKTKKKMVKICQTHKRDVWCWCLNKQLPQTVWTVSRGKNFRGFWAFWTFSPKLFSKDQIQFYHLSIILHTRIGGVFEILFTWITASTLKKKAMWIFFLLEKAPFMNSSTKIYMTTKMSTDAGVWYIIYNMHSWWTQASNFYSSLK